MKKGTYLLFAAAGLLLATSCVREAEDFAAGNEGVVTIQAQLPADFSTRAIGDGSTATTLTYAVYDKAKTDAPVLCVEDAADVTFVNNKAKLTLRLATGHSYDIVFWADANVANNPYTFNAANKTITVSYTDAAANDESRDAFFGQIENLEVNGAISQTVTLTRPFAQLNLGTDDAEAAEQLGVTIAKSAVKVTNVYTTLNLLDGSVSDETEATFAAAAVPTEQLTVGDKKYGYLGMNYVLVSEADETLTECTITLNDGTNDLPEIALNSVPLKRNHRTNVLGSLITSPVDFTINIDKEFGGDIDIDSESKVVDNQSELLQAMKDGGKYRLTENITLSTVPTITKDLEMDLGGKTLTLSSSKALAPNADVTFTNGIIIDASNKGVTSAAIAVKAGKTATFENVEFTTSGVAIFPSSDATVVIRDSKITAMNSYAVSTNASAATTATAPANITIENTELNGKSPVLINVPCELTMKDVTVNGTMHGVVLRGGTATIEDCTVTLTRNDNSLADYFKTHDWSQGNTVPLAALTVGNKGAGAYQYPTNVTIKNSTFKVAGAGAAFFPALYGYANSGEGMGVTIEYDEATCTFDNGTDKPIVFGSENITVNGTAVTL